MNTQNILNSQEVKNFIKSHNSQTIINELGVPQDNSTYSAEAQLLEDPWETKREMKEATKQRMNTNIKKMNKDLIRIVWVNDLAPEGLTDETGTYSLVSVKPNNRTCDENGDNNKMKRVYRNNKDWQRKVGDPHCVRANAFALLKVEGKVCYLGRKGKGSLHIRQCYTNDPKQNGRKVMDPTDQLKQQVRTL